ncbi:MAG: hypothetical protein ACI9DC_000042 [Gammaproteobacteria bacterium]
MLSANSASWSRLRCTLRLLLQILEHGDERRSRHAAGKAASAIEFDRGRIVPVHLECDSLQIFRFHVRHELLDQSSTDALLEPAGPYADIGDVGGHTTWIIAVSGDQSDQDFVRPSFEADRAARNLLRVVGDAHLRTQRRYEGKARRSQDVR